MLELLEELEPGARKAFQNHVHMNELTALSVNGTRGGALVLTNRYLYLISRGLFGRRCQVFPPHRISKAEVQGNSLVLEAGAEVYRLNLPAKKLNLLPDIIRRIQCWQEEKTG